MRLNLIPDVEGYGVKMSNTDAVISNDLLGGSRAVRLDMLNVTYIVNVQYTLNPERYNYLREFFATYFDTMPWFDVLLVIEPYIAEYPLRNYKAQIIPGSIRLILADGLKYIVAFQMECYLDDVPLTSKNYPVDDNDSMNVSFNFVSGNMKITDHKYYNWPNENIGTNFSFISGDLRLKFQQYNNWPNERIGIGFNYVSGSMKVVIRNYNNWPVENIGTTFNFVNGSIKVTFVSYNNWPIENIGISFNFVSGSLT